MALFLLRRFSLVVTPGCCPPPPQRRLTYDGCDAAAATLGGKARPAAASCRCGPAGDGTPGSDSFRAHPPPALGPAPALPVFCSHRPPPGASGGGHPAPPPGVLGPPPLGGVGDPASDDAYPERPRLYPGGYPADAELPGRRGGPPPPPSASLSDSRASRSLAASSTLFVVRPPGVGAGLRGEAPPSSLDWEA